MFDLIEQDLSQQEPTQQSDGPAQTGPPDISDSISVLSERFRPVIKKRKKGNVLVITVITFFVVVAIGSVAVLLIVSRPQEAPKTKQQQNEQQTAQRSEQEQPLAEEQQKSALEAATSTSAVVEPEVSATELQSTNTTVRPLPEEEPQVSVTAAPSEPLLQGIDSDGDGLTDSEERMYGTNDQLPDSDADGFFDGEELKKLFDPVRGQGARLDISPLAHSYVNTAFKYRMLFPASWVAKAVNSTEREVLFTSSTGEFISMNVEDNLSGITPLEWYVTIKEPGMNPAQLQTISGATWNGVVSSSGRTIYFNRRSDGSQSNVPLMYSLTYNLNTKNEVNFLTTFQMMIQSFAFTDLTFVK